MASLETSVSIAPHMENTLENSKNLILEMEALKQAKERTEVGAFGSQYSEGADEVQACRSGEFQRRRECVHLGFVGCDGELPT